MDKDLANCVKKNIHNRTEKEIEDIINDWEPTPLTETVLDIRSLLQDASIPEVSSLYLIIELQHRFTFKIIVYYMLIVSLLSFVSFMGLSFVIVDRYISGCVHKKFKSINSLRCLEVSSRVYWTH